MKIKLGLQLKKTIEMPSVFLLLIAALMIIRDVGDIGVNKYFFVVLCFLCFINKDKSEIYKSIAFITPLAGGLPYTYIIVLAQMFIVLKEKGRRKFDLPSLTCILLLLLMEFVSIIRGYFSIVEFIGFAFIVWFSLTRMSDLDDNYDNEGIAIFFIAGYFAAIINIFGQVLTKYSWVQLLTMGSVLERFGNTTDALSIMDQQMRLSFNPNGLGCICIQVLVIALLLQHQNKKKVYLAVVTLALVVGLMTQSRTFLVTVIIVGILYLTSTTKSLKTVLSGIGVSIVLIGASSIIISKWFSSYVQGLQLRMQATDITNGRVGLFQIYNEFILRHVNTFLFGVGLQRYPEKYGYYQSCHNAIQEIIVAWGLIGLAITVFFFARVLIRAYRKVGKSNVIFFLPIIATFIMVQAGQGFRDEVGLLRLVVMYSVILIPFDTYRQTSSQKTGCDRKIV